MQFPNCTAKVRVSFVRANSLAVFHVFYNIVSEMKGSLYTYKHFRLKKQTTETPKRLDGCPL